MNNNVVKSYLSKRTFVMLFGISALLLSGCSADYLREGYVPPNRRVITKIPEIQPQVTKPKTVVRQVVKPYKPTVQKYTISSSSSTVIPQKQTSVIAPEIISVKKDVAIDIDPYATIPESSASSAPKVQAVRKASPAVISLMTRARADLSVGKTQSAISKLERGLRIDSQNPKIWHLLAKAHYDQSNHQQAITMAKKSIRYAGDDKLVAANWVLIKKAGEKSDDAIAIKEALDYFKVNP